MFRVILSFLSILFSFACFSQGKEDKNNDLFDIRLKYQAINKYKNYKVEIIEGSEDFIGHATDGGGNLQGYYKGDTLVKIVEWVGLSNRNVQNVYYLDKKDLFLVYAKEERFPWNDSLQTLDYSTLVVSFTGRYYFKNNKLIDTILSHKKTNQETSKDAAGFLKRVKEYTALVNKKRK